jgi:hypothetical protein
LNRKRRSSDLSNETLIARRIATRHEHFMPESLLHSHFEALEEPGPEENPIIVSIEPLPREIVARLAEALAKALGGRRKEAVITTKFGVGYPDAKNYRDSGRKRVYVLASHQHFYMENVYDSQYLREHGGVLPGWVIVLPRGCGACGPSTG